MKNLKYITGFRFGYARYNLEDGAGDSLLLKIDYQHDKYKIVSQGPVINPHFRAEVNRIASDLLARKHGVNFARKVD